MLKQLLQVKMLKLLLSQYHCITHWYISI